MGKIYFVVAETLGTDGEFYSEVYPCSSEQDAGECATSLVADMAETMGIEEYLDPFTWGIKGENWWYRVRTECHSMPCDAYDDEDVDEQ